MTCSYMGTLVRGRVQSEKTNLQRCVSMLPEYNNSNNNNVTTTHASPPAVDTICPCYHDEVTFSTQPDRMCQPLLPARSRRHVPTTTAVVFSLQIYTAQ